MKTSIRFSFPFLIALLAVLPLRMANPCGYDPPAFAGYHLTDMGALSLPAVPPFSLEEYSYVFSRRLADWSRGNDENIEEWRGYFSNVPSLEDISAFVYKSTLADLLDVQRKTEDPQHPVDEKWAANSLVQHLLRTDHHDFLAYLVFAKECEPFATRRTYWWENGQQQQLDPSLVGDLNETGRYRYGQVRDPMLKLRYAFQIVRLEHYYEGDPVSAYDELVRPLEQTPSVMRYWALGHKAGFLTQSENQAQRAQGNFLLAQVVANTRQRMYSNYQSFNIQSDAEWEQALGYGRTSTERANLYYTRALDSYSVALEDMETIYQLEPAYRQLDILLLREIHKLEATLLHDQAHGKREVPQSRNYIPIEEAAAYRSRLKAFVSRVAAEKRVADPAIWLIADGYLDYLGGEVDKAQTAFKTARQSVPAGSRLWDQLELYEFAATLRQKNAVEPWMEEWLGEIIRRNQFYRWYKEDGTTVGFPYDQADFILEQLAYLYARAGAYGKAYLCRFSIYGLKYYPDARIAREVLALFDKTGRNGFEQFLLDKEERVKTREEIVDLWGTALLGEYRLTEALAVFEQIPKFGTIIEEPFKTESLLDEAQGNYATRERYTKYELAKRLLELERLLLQDPVNAPRYHLLLGNYQVNSSYYGSAWLAIDYFISRSSSRKDSARVSSWPLDFDHDYGNVYGNYLPGYGVRGNKEFMDLSKAVYHYKRALQSEDPEIAAQACLMLARYENRLPEPAIPDRYQVLTLGNKWYTPYFNQLGLDFPGTKAYDSFIRECSGFEDFVRNDLGRR